jgi:hypothetical protein
MGMLSTLELIKLMLQLKILAFWGTLLNIYRIKALYAEVINISNADDTLAQYSSCAMGWVARGQEPVPGRDYFLYSSHTDYGSHSSSFLQG